MKPKGREAVELWEKHRGRFLLVIGMACFLAAGLLVRFLPPESEIGKDSHRRGRSAVTEQAPPTPPAEAPAHLETPPAEKAQIPSQPRPAPRGVLSVHRDSDGEPEVWCLYVTGSVRNPGVYKLPAGARLFQLVEAAGGLNNFADTVAVNMAAVLEDGLHVHIPRKGENVSENPPPPAGSAVVLSMPRPSAPRGNPALVGIRSAEAKEQGLIDVNRASQEELTALKGIGPALAKSIVEYRQKNGLFRNVEDLLQVRGIGTKKLEGFRGNVIVKP
jgi:competence protein ComEA